VPVTARAADEAGASTFESARKRYATPHLAREDIPVPKSERKPPVNLPSVPDTGPGDAQLVFPINGFEVSGNTLLLPSKIDNVLKPYVKGTSTIADVEAARDALQKAYDTEGFLFIVVSLPQQTIGDGQVRLDVVENRLGEVTLDNEGVKWFSDDLVRRDTPHLVPGAILRKDDLAEDLERANQNPDRRVKAPVPTAGKVRGTADLRIEVDDRIPLHGGLTFNNFYTPGSPTTRMTSTLSYANLWGLEHSASVAYQFAPDYRYQDVQIYSGTYSAPMPWNREQSVFGYVVNSSTSSTIPAAPGLAVSGKGLNAGVRFISPLPAIPSLEGFSHSGTFGADRKDIQNGLFAPAVRILTPITYLPFSAGYTANLLTPQTFTSVHLGLSFNFAGMVDGGSKTTFQQNRGGVRATNPVTGTYQIFTGSGNFTLRLPALLQTLSAGRWIENTAPATAFTDDWTFNVVMRGQAASQPLISTEQFAAGGVQTVRGYLESEVIGDDALNVQAELRTPFFRNFFGGFLSERAQLCLFYDGALLYTLSTTATPEPSQDIQGVGVGVRTSFFDTLLAEFFVAHPRTPTAYTGNNMWRYHFQMSVGF
jgi:hemolysin activation/secretion protein